VHPLHRSTGSTGSAYCCFQRTTAHSTRLLMVHCALAGDLIPAGDLILECRHRVQHTVAAGRMLA
jgi:hypothetical protein